MCAAGQPPAGRVHGPVRFHRSLRLRLLVHLKPAQHNEGAFHTEAPRYFVPPLMIRTRRGRSPIRIASGSTAADANEGTNRLHHAGREKYHHDGCRYLSHSRIPISLKEAKANGYTPCKVSIFGGKGPAYMRFFVGFTMWRFHPQQRNHRRLPHQNGSPSATSLRLQKLPELSFEG